MRLFNPLLAVIIIVGVSASCKRNNKQDSPSEPYPTLEEQRSELSVKPRATPTRLLDSTQIITDLEYLASDICEGRRPGLAGHQLAINRLVTRMREAGVDSFDNTLLQPFTGITVNGTTAGVNVIGWLKGATFPDKYIVISGHYDHLGKAPGGAIYHGADDNASGTSCLLALAKYFKQFPHPYSLVFAAFDREETGFEGANHFFETFEHKVGKPAIVFNLNMDMIARSDNNEIFACGIKHTPSFKYAVNEIQNKTNVVLLMGHDGGTPGDDWTEQSDHAVFHREGIPFIYLGVEDHPDYHRTTDTFDKISKTAYIENCNMVLLMAKTLKP